MRVVGVDPSSACCGVALVEGERLLATRLWHKTNGRSAPWNLNDYYVWLVRLLRDDPEFRAAPMVAVEFLSVTRNAKTVRVVSHYQAASVLAVKQAGKMVVEARVSTARKLALGNGGMSKDEAWEEVKRRFPEHKWVPKNRGGQDETDATVLALAGPEIAEL